MNDNKMQNDKSFGGFILPEVAYIDITRKGTLFSVVRWFGNRVIRLGAFILSLGYEQKEIHPQKALLEYIKGYKLR